MGSTAKQRRRWHLMLKAQWQGKEITTCEVRFDGCVGSFGLAPAHSRKRRLIETREQYFEVVAACQKCHEILDQNMSHETMEATVKSIIAKREHNA